MKKFLDIIVKLVLSIICIPLTIVGTTLLSIFYVLYFIVVVPIIVVGDIFDNTFIGG